VVRDLQVFILEPLDRSGSLRIRTPTNTRLATNSELGEPSRTFLEAGQVGASSGSGVNVDGGEIGWQHWQFGSLQG
jgi:hypothetical protein